jgi:hypothetical protein
MNRIHPYSIYFILRVFQNNVFEQLQATSKEACQVPHVWWSAWWFLVTSLTFSKFSFQLNDLVSHVSPSFTTAHLPCSQFPSIDCLVLVLFHVVPMYFLPWCSSAISLHGTRSRMASRVVSLSSSSPSWMRPSNCPKAIWRKKYQVQTNNRGNLRLFDALNKSWHHNSEK